MTEKKKKLVIRVITALIVICYIAIYYHFKEEKTYNSIASIIQKDGNHLKNILKKYDYEDSVDLIVFNNKEQLLNFYSINKETKNNKTVYRPVIKVSQVFKLGPLEEELGLKENAAQVLKLYENPSDTKNGESRTAVFGLTPHKEVYTLSINNQKVTDVLELNIDGKPQYAWYIDDFDIEEYRDDSDNVKIDTKA